MENQTFMIRQKLSFRTFYTLNNCFENNTLYLDWNADGDFLDRNGRVIPDANDASNFEIRT